MIIDSTRSHRTNCGPEFVDNRSECLDVFRCDRLHLVWFDLVWCGCREVGTRGNVVHNVSLHGVFVAGVSGVAEGFEGHHTLGRHGWASQVRCHAYRQPRHPGGQSNLFLLDRISISNITVTTTIITIAWLRVGIWFNWYSQKITISHPYYRVTVLRGLKKTFHMQFW